MPFSSARKWSGAAFHGHGTWVLGAADVLLEGRGDTFTRTADALADEGHRVLLLARTSRVSADGVFGDVQPQALVALGERVREDAAPTLSYFASQGVSTKIISGDHPRTVAVVAAQVAMAGAGDPVDGRDLPEAPGAFADVVESNDVFGRVSPHQKRAMVEALQRRRHVVAMTGDGVNDVLALKDADIGIAMGNGSPASRAVAQLVLLDGEFATLPDVVSEGRRVIANIERVGKLFVTKTVYAMLLAIAVGVAGLPFPFLPRHLTLVGSLTIGIPAFFLALEPNTRRARRGFVRRILAFSIPAGIAAAAATFAAYRLVDTAGAANLDEARTTATLTLLGIGLLILRLLTRPLNRLRTLVIVAMVASFAVVLAVPQIRTFYALDLPGPLEVLAAVGLVAITGVTMEAARGLIERVRREWRARRRSARWTEASP